MWLSSWVVKWLCVYVVMCNWFKSYFKIPLGPPFQRGKAVWRIPYFIFNEKLLFQSIAARAFKSIFLSEKVRCRLKSFNPSMAGKRMAEKYRIYDGSSFWCVYFLLLVPWLLTLIWYYLLEKHYIGLKLVILKAHKY